MLLVQIMWFIIPDIGIQLRKVKLQTAPTGLDRQKMFMSIIQWL